MMTENEPRVARPVPTEGPIGLPNEPYYRRGEQARRWGALLLIVGVVWLVFALAARGEILGLGFAERTQMLPAQSFAAERVVIAGVSDNVEFVAAPGDEVVLTGVKYGFGWNGAAAEDALADLQLSVREEGDTLQIEVTRPPRLGAILGRAPYVDLVVALPVGVGGEARVMSGDIALEDVRGDLLLETVSGSVEGDATAGALMVRTTSGDVRLSDHRGPLDVETTSGDVRASGALAGPRVETVSGDVRLEGASGTVAAQSISGDVAIGDAAGASLQIESTSGDVVFSGALLAGSTSQITNISGDVRVRLADVEDLRVELSTLSGDLEADLPLRGAEREQRSLRGSVGAGTTSLLVSTTSGDVAVGDE
jgi:hypothetical protein